VRNLDESVKIPQLVDTLHAIFSAYGNVIDIVAKSSVKRKGQAFVVFDDVESAARAIDEVDGFEVFDKPMKLEFARTTSDATIKRMKGEDSEEFERHKRARLAEKGTTSSFSAISFLMARVYGLKTKLGDFIEHKQAATASHTAPKPVAADPKAGVPAKGVAKPKPATGTVVIPDEYLPPNKILFIQNIPEDYGVESLTGLFGRYAGFKEVRTVPGRTNIAFVEYENEQSAIDAKQQTGSLTLGDKTIKVTYQRQ